MVFYSFLVIPLSCCSGSEYTSGFRNSSPDWRVQEESCRPSDPAGAIDTIGGRPVYLQRTGSTSGLGRRSSNKVLLLLVAEFTYPRMVGRT